MSAFDYKNKVVVITGGASGMGRSFITHILTRGGLVSFGDVNTALSKSLLLQIHATAPRFVSRLLFTKTDIRDARQVANLMERTVEVFGKIDVLLCVAGVNVPDSFIPALSKGRDKDGGLDATPNLLNIQVNLCGTITTIYASMQHLAPGGTIVVVASTAGVYPSSVQPLYSASKHGLIGFSRSVAPLLRIPCRQGKVEEPGQRILVLAPSTYLPPHHRHPTPPPPEIPVPASPLFASAAASDRGASRTPPPTAAQPEGEEHDVFTKVIGETLGFVEMSTILQTLDAVLRAGKNGDVIEILPGHAGLATFPEAPAKMAEMDAKLRAELCGSRVAVTKEEPMDHS